MTEYEEKDIQQEVQEQMQEQVPEPVIEPQQEETGSNERPAEEANEELFARMEAEMAEYETPGRGDLIIKPAGSEISSISSIGRIPCREK